MAEARVKKAHSLGLDGAMERAQTAEKDLASRYGASTQWKGNQLHFSRLGVKGHIEVRGSEVEFYANLGLLGGPLKGKVETKAKEILERYFSPTA